MNPVFQFLLKGIGSEVLLGKKGPILKAVSTGIEVRRPDNSGLTNLKTGSPVEGNDAVNLEWVKREVLTNWNTPVQNLEELRSIPSDQRKDKQIRLVEIENTFYQYDADSNAIVPDEIDILRTILPKDLNPSEPGRWLKTTARTSLHSELIGLSLDDHPQYQLKNEKNKSNGYVGINSESELEILSDQGRIKNVLKSNSSQKRNYILPDSSGTIALEEAFIGATTQFNGKKGLVPTPLITDTEKFLSGDGSWKNNFGTLKNSNVITTHYTASKYERVLCDVTGGSFNVILPNDPNDAIVIGILDISNKAGTYPINLLRNSKKIENLEEDWQLDLDAGSYELVFSKEKESWYFLGTPSTQNLVTTNTIVSDLPSFTEISIAPSANSVRLYLESTLLNVYQMISERGTVFFGVGYLNSGTRILNSYFETTTDNLGNCNLPTGLTNKIISVFGTVSDNQGKWISPISFYYENGNISFTFGNTFANRSVRIRVEHK
ncbi:hypothetical protein LEP1GSC079_5234 [Leptospira interrogans str. FPW1039]|uniref:Uncharacterized protein n=2 Tax=Leptospira interrogans TaxID=173 RepID=A0A0E2DA90_LEPIR|nr:hypothetical protein [Leptospira interrogans]EKR52567.1 hypothetical protein LEP1GSC105_0008 [Leptospira interrogans str. UI 12758]EMJ35409.1 hypothetical protein LEP1GSC079_5234 [Leptospira interrogans str. FPW1039]